MKLPIISGVIYPTQLPVVDAGQYVEVTTSQARAVMQDWTAETPVAYTENGGTTPLTESLASEVQSALASSPAMAEVSRLAAEHKADVDAAAAQARAGLSSGGSTPAEEIRVGV